MAASTNSSGSRPSSPHVVMSSHNANWCPRVACTNAQNPFQCAHVTASFAVPSSSNRHGCTRLASALQNYSSISLLNECWTSCERFLTGFSFLMLAILSAEPSCTSSRSDHISCCDVLMAPRSSVNWSSDIKVALPEADPRSLVFSVSDMVKTTSAVHALFQ